MVLSFATSCFASKSTLVFLHRKFIPDHLPLYSGFSSLQGLNLVSSHKILAKLGWDLTQQFKDLEQFPKMLKLISLASETYLRQFLLKENNKILIFESHKSFKTFKGYRLIFHLPLNGQNTHSNRQTRKRFKIL